MESRLSRKNNIHFRYFSEPALPASRMAQPEGRRLRNGKLVSTMDEVVSISDGSVDEAQAVARAPVRGRAERQRKQLAKQEVKQEGSAAGNRPAKRERDEEGSERDMEGRPRQAKRGKRVVDVGREVLQREASEREERHINEPIVIDDDLDDDEVLQRVLAESRAAVKDSDSGADVSAAQAGSSDGHAVAGPSNATVDAIDLEDLADAEADAPAPARSPSPTHLPATFDSTLASILSVLPNICPDHVASVLRRFHVFDVGMSTAEASASVLERIFEDGPYPKKAAKGKAGGGGNAQVCSSSGASGSGPGGAAGQLKWVEWAMEVDIPDGEGSGGIQYQSEKSGLEERKGEYYNMASQALLANLFLELRMADITLARSQHNNLLVPTFIHLFSDRSQPEDKRTYPSMKIPRETKAAYTPVKAKAGSSRSKGKARASGRALGMTASMETDPERFEGKAAFDAEKAWLERWLRVQDGPEALAMVKALFEATTEPDTECACCFGEEHIEFMVPCQEGHLFCCECVHRLIQGSVGEHKRINCVDGSGCKAEFAHRDLKKTAGEKLFIAFQNVMQRLELEEAGIEGLESCPRCEYAVVMEDPDEKLFRCQREECMFVSCRTCHKADHIPKSCEEAAKDTKLDYRHTVEEAMSDALIRKCPNPACAKPFLKESGCNKINCSYCRQTSCYICRKIITDGYKHFDQDPVDYNQPKRTDRCRLWDPVGRDMYADEVAKAKAAAEKEALEAAAKDGAEVAAEDIAVAAPEQRFLNGRAAAPGADLLAGLGGGPDLLAAALDRYRYGRGHHQAHANGHAHGAGLPLPIMAFAALPALPALGRQVPAAMHAAPPARAGRALPAAPALRAAPVAPNAPARPRARAAAQPAALPALPAQREARDQMAAFYEAELRRQVAAVRHGRAAPPAPAPRNRQAAQVPPPPPNDYLAAGELFDGLFDDIYGGLGDLERIIREGPPARPGPARRPPPDADGLAARANAALEAARAHLAQVRPRPAAPAAGRAGRGAPIAAAPPPAPQVVADRAMAALPARARRRAGDGARA